jgi:hypothetical protein
VPVQRPVDQAHYRQAHTWSSVCAVIRSELESVARSARANRPTVEVPALRSS